MRLRSVRTVLVSVALAAATLAAAQPASAAQVGQTGGADLAAQAVQATPDSGATRAAAQCPSPHTVVFGIDWGGMRLCGYGYGGHELGSGTLQVYVVGTDYRVWTRYRNPSGVYSGWQVLKDGRVKPGDYRSIVVTTTSALYPQLRVIGNENPGRWWCIERLSSGWNNWHVC